MPDYALRLISPETAAYTTLTFSASNDEEALRLANEKDGYNKKLFREIHPLPESRETALDARLEEMTTEPTETS